MCQRLLANPLIEDYEIVRGAVGLKFGVIRFPGLVRRRRRAARGLRASARRCCSGTPTATCRASTPSSSPAASPTATTCASARSRASRRSWSPSSRSRATAGSCSGSATASRSSARRACCRARCCPTTTCASSAARSTSRSSTPTRRSRARASPGERLSIPVKHTTGRYYAPDERARRGSRRAGQVVLRYAPGENPNGSLRDIAGVCNAAGNVFGLMPHPEHAVDALTGGSADGLQLFASMAEAVDGASPPDDGRAAHVDDAVALGLTRAEYDADRATSSAARPTRSSSRCSRCCGASTAPTSTRRSCCARCRPRAATCVMGPGENAGAVDVGDGLAVAFKVESHNHPSAVEPFQGAATGVGGILRDIFAIGARPIAVLDSLRFGEPGDLGALALPARPRGRRASATTATRSACRRSAARSTSRRRTSRTASSTRWPSGSARRTGSDPQRGRGRRQRARPVRRLDGPRRHRRRVGARVAPSSARPTRTSARRSRSATRSRRRS